MTPEEIDAETNKWKAAIATRKSAKAISEFKKGNITIHRETITEDSGGNPLIITEHNDSGV